MANPSGTALAFSGPLVDAQRAWSALRGHGLEAWILNQNQGVLVELDSVTVTVRAEELEQATAVLTGLGLVHPHASGKTKGSR